MSTEYIGKMFDGQMHGPGKLIYENDEYYSGDFVRGEGSRVRKIAVFATSVIEFSLLMRNHHRVVVVE
jgi:MORN repeat